MSAPTSTPSGPQPNQNGTDWRGVAAEHTENVSSTVAGLLRGRSRRLLGSLLAPHRRTLWVVLGLVVVQNLASLAGPALIGAGIDRGIPPLLRGEGGGTLAAVGVAFAVATLLQVVTQRSFMLLTGRIGQDVVLDLRTRVFEHFQRLSMAFHEDYTSGRVISRQTSDVDAISEFLDGGVDAVVRALLSIVGIGVTMLLLDVPLALVGLASFVPLFALTLWFRRESATAYRTTREAVAMVIVQIVETLTGIRAVQAFRREPRNEQIFAALNERYRAASQKSFSLMAVYGPGMKLISNVTIALILFYGGTRVLDGELGVGVLTAFLLYLRRFFDPLQDLAQFFNALQSATAALEKLSGVLEEAPSVPDAERPRALPAPRGAVRFDAVSFGYKEKVVLPGLDLHVPAGQTVALVGATGAGKTTIARLLGRFYDPVEGRVLLDDVDLREVEEHDLHRAVVTVTQESFLFSGSVADNIAFGRPGASRRDIEEAARRIGAHEFIAALPEGYDTDVRKRGGRLSAGQRQLVSFARAFLADPAVLVLDEATSSLDIPHERLVQSALRTILADRTALIIAHRLSTVEIADRVLVLSDGRVVEDGPPHELATGTGPYARLHHAWRQSLHRTGAA
ncbi:ABC transporter ATP-binding protein [Kineosporia sp. A_224]|uniref:ABC transporter ATP-binding protein n=1 Tax=Kineosporia sp. A_224 TaxID=1962180 RepID=UPI000B4A85E3|nr:ABC transporter ATP-binding protein [Kineosporia sp. A_224]